MYKTEEARNELIENLGHLDDPEKSLSEALDLASFDVLEYPDEYIDALTDNPGELMENKKSGLSVFWGYFVWAALRKLKLRTHGIEKLVRYFQEACEYESMLYGIDPERYRAHHAAHVFSVFIHGWRLLNDENGFMDCLTLYSRDFSDHYTTQPTHWDHCQTERERKPHFYSRYDGEQQQFFDTKEIEKNNIQALWTIAALCHDLGYALEKTSHLNKRARDIFQAYGGIQLSDLAYSPNFGQQDLFGLLLRALSSVVHCVTKDYGKNKLALFRIQQVFLAKRYAALVEMDHGIASALLVWKTLEGISDVVTAPSGKLALGPEPCVMFIRIREALAAIADHNNIHLASRVCSLGFLLRICDEVSEAARPRGKELFGTLTGSSASLPKLLERIQFSQVKQPDQASDGQQRSEYQLKIIYTFNSRSPNPLIDDFIKSQARKRRKLEKIFLKDLHRTKKGAALQQWKLQIEIEPSTLIQSPELLQVAFELEGTGVTPKTGAGP